MKLWLLMSLCLKKLFLFNEKITYSLFKRIKNLNIIIDKKSKVDLKVSNKCFF